jgi:hypothetical protein
MPDLTYVKTGRPEFDELIPKIRAFLEQDTMDMVIDGDRIRGYRSPDTPAVWLRDHSDMMRGFRHFEQDMTSAVTHFADTQARNGRVFDYFTVQPEKVPCERENWCKYVRVPVEADVEYRFVNAAFIAWQATGDDAWIRSILPNLERALEYAFTHPWRWDPELELVKRPYTIDSWDFAYTAGSHDWLQFQIDDNTFWGILHGDNSGYYQACHRMAAIYSRLGTPDRASHWKRFAEGLKTRMNQVCWNGTFYTHFVKKTPVEIPGVDEASQLSFSNPMDINRGVTSQEQASSILREYRQRGQNTGAFAEWFSIQPPFPDGIFGDEKIVEGAYCNGGIMPLVGGELANAYLASGYEAEGVETLKRYYELISKNNETFLWYFPDGTESTVDTSTSPDATPTDGWGSSSMLCGLVEGLAGVKDQGKTLDRVSLAPRWSAAGINLAEVQVGYECSGASLRYAYQENSNDIRIQVETSQSQAHISQLLPPGATVERVTARGETIPFTTRSIEKSQYIDFDATINQGEDFTIAFH